MSSRKRKRASRDLRCVLFPDDVRSAAGRRSSEPPVLSSESSARSWQRCGDSFLDTPVMEELQTSGRKLSAVRKLTQFKASGQSGRSEEPVDIAWSSSDSERSDNERSSAPRRAPRAPPTSTSQRDELPDIESGSDDPSDEHREDADGDQGQQISDCDSESCGEQKPARSPHTEDKISQCGSDSEDVLSSLASTRPDSAPSQAGRRSLSDWVRSAQAMLQTPQKQMDRQSKTPEDSGRKRRKLLSGGLAERLNCLQSRQRSAVSFWKHQSDSSVSVTSSGDRPGVLVLEVLEVHHECSMHVARCERRGPPSPGDDRRHAGTDVLVLFNRETAAQLMPAPRDVIHIHPPWQSLSVEGFSCPVILNTHFSQKVSSTSASPSAELAGRLPAPSRAPYHLGKLFGRLEANGATEDRGPQQSPDAACGLPAGLGGRPCVSLLEAIEGLGQAGCVEQEVEVVVQRVYSVPVSSCSPVSVLKSRAGSRPSAPPPPPPPAGEVQTRLCVLVQDNYGTFSVVQLHLLPSRDLLHHYCLLWQGRNCTLRGIKVVQRLTRERSCWLFSLIDSLWPPKVPLKHHGSSLRAPTESGSAVPPPSFCYLLSGQNSSVRPAEPQTASPLYIQPEERHLRDILQTEAKTCRCSFVATVLYKRIQGGDGGRPDFWLVLTDRSLQEDPTERPSTLQRRTLPLCIKPSCVLTPSVLTALRSPAACRMAFRDALREHGVLLCVEQSVVQLFSTETEPSTLPRPEAEPSTLPRPVRLDPLRAEAWPCSLVRLSGVIVGVDEDSAFSWPTCSHCGSDNLEIPPETPQSFLCVSCRSVVDEPDMKIQLEVFLTCSSLKEATVKLQQTTICSLLNVTTSNRSELSGLDVESILGKEVGPMAAYVRVVTRSPSLWIGLDEVPLQS
ncbi:DNA repair-scaffolding protein isoform X2 [Salarias fasciatus]|uniref:DNA repair-scaffolding protein isoform X2 n=1 Tax=Salarias fasciatus TaxID=181472 RepID=UPI001176F488|nr:DNA repair-scaffolding protein isoform X2 [Salarias fasciatus]